MIGIAAERTRNGGVAFLEQRAGSGLSLSRPPAMMARDG